MSKPINSIFPIMNGRLNNDLDANGFQIQNLDTSNLPSGGGGGGGGIDTGTTVAILKGDGNHGIADAIPDSDYATVASVAAKENTANHNADVSAINAQITTINTVLPTKADSSSVTAGLATKASDADLQAYKTSNDAAVAAKADSAAMTTALAAKADTSTVTTALAGKEPLLPTTANDAYVLARHNAGAGGNFFFVDPVTLGTTSQTFTDGVENSTTTFTSATANFVAGDVGKTITGAGIPAGTTIASRTNSTTIVLSAAATATASGVTFTILNRLVVGGTGTVTNVAVVNNVTDLLATSVANPATSAQVTINPATSVPANSFYGNGTGFTGTAGFMNAAAARNSLGGSTAGQNLFQVANPNAISFPRFDATNAASTRTPAQVLADIGAENALTFTAPLNRATNTISIPPSTASANGYLTSTDFASFTAKPPNARTIATTAPLTGGGDLSANRTIAIPPATATADGYLTAGDFNSFTAKPPNSRTIATTAPLTGGGDLSANRNIVLPAASPTADGYLSATDYNKFSSGAGVPISAGVGGTVTILNLTPLVTRVVLNTQLTSALTINLPSAANYNSGVGFPFIEIVDIVQGGAQTSTFGVTLQRSGSDLLDGVVSIVLPKAMSYLRVNSNGSNRWTTTKYYVDSFKDPATPTKTVRVDVSTQTAGANYVLRPATLGDSVTVQPYIAPAKEWIRTIGSDGSVASSQPSASDVLPVEFVAPAGSGTVTITDDGTVTSVRNGVAITGSSRSFVFPNVSNYDAGEIIRFYDASGSVTPTSLARVLSTSGNTFNGLPTIDISEQYFNRVFVANPATGNWTVSTFGGTTGSGLAIDPWNTATIVSGQASIVCNSGIVQSHHIVNMTGDVTLVMSGTVQNGSTGRIKFRDATGNHVVTVPNAIGKTPTTSGTGTFTTSTGTNIEDEYGWDFDGSFYNFYPIGLKMIAAAPPTFGTIADDTTTGQTTSNSGKLGDSGTTKYRAARLVADGGITNGGNYTIGKIRLRLFKTGTPTYNNYCQIRADSGTNVPTSIIVGSTSAAVAVSGYSTSEADVDFNTNATLIGARQVTSITTTSGSPTITGIAGQFLAGDVGTLITGTGIATGSLISSVAADGSSATLTLNATASGTVTVTIKHIYWIVVYGDNAAADAVNYVSWAFHSVTSQVLTTNYRSNNGTTWTGVSNVDVYKYITYK